VCRLAQDRSFLVLSWRIVHAFDDSVAGR
jgi:hypothetical protein